MARVNYNRVAPVYEALGYIYSGRQIYDAKASQIAEIEPQDRVLYVGVGPGEDAVLAARQGARVTCIDISTAMLCQAEARMTREGLTAEFLQCDLVDHDRREFYDVVIVNFFLNVFCEEDMRRMLCHLATLAKAGGKVLISDFMPPEGNLLARAAQATYWGVTNLFYFLLGLSAWHPVYDYTAYFDAAGLALLNVRRFRPLKVAPVGFWAVTAMRSAAPGRTGLSSKRASTIAA
ncbi:MAG: methyltransferase domain-containing protein [Planctomycetia bacterium]|nr:methyltransferase domain-containing protein [Planctomycetia bacterium]